MKLDQYLAMAHLAERNLSEALLMVADRHDKNAEIRDQAKMLAAWSNQNVETMQQFLQKYGEDKSRNQQVQNLRGALFHGVRVGGSGLMADLQDLSLMATQVHGLWTTIWQAAKALPDRELELAADEACKHSDRQISWLETHTKIIGPQAVIVEADKDSELQASIPKRPTPTSLMELGWAPLVGGALMLIIGIAGLIAGILMGKPAGLPWLFPSLGPSAYLQAASPAKPEAHFYNTIVGHAAGVLAGYLSVFLFNAYYDPVVLVSHTLTPGRVAASALALALTLMLALVMKASHPPAGATTLLISLGAFKIEDFWTIVIGVVLVAVAGEVFRRMRLGQLTFRTEKQEKKAPAPKPQG